MTAKDLHDISKARVAAAEAAKAADIETARRMRAAGSTLYEIAIATGRSKDWLRAYAGIA